MTQEEQKKALEENGAYKFVFRYWYSEDEDKKHVEKGQYRDGIKNK